MFFSQCLVPEWLLFGFCCLNTLTRAQDLIHRISPGSRKMHAPHDSHLTPTESLYRCQSFVILFSLVNYSNNGQLNSLDSGLLVQSCWLGLSVNVFFHNVINLAWLGHCVSNLVSLCQCQQQPCVIVSVSASTWNFSQITIYPQLLKWGCPRAMKQLLDKNISYLTRALRSI